MLLSRSEEGMVRVRAMVDCPHDKLFKLTFTRLDVARLHLASLLPERIAKRVDWSTLKLEPGSFVDEELAAMHSDLLYSASIGGRPGLVYVLCEHFSTFDRFSPLRIFIYVASIWKRWLAEKEKGAFAPPVVAVVLHHSASGWRAKPSLASVFHPEDVEAFGDLLPSLHFVLDDLTPQTPEDIGGRKSHELAILALLALAISSNRDKLPGAVPIFQRVLRSVEGTPENRSAIIALYKYLFTAGPDDKERKGEVRAMLIEAAGSRFREDVMSVADQLKAEGRIEGRVEGRVEGLRNSVFRVLSARKLALSDLGRARIEQCADVDRLMLWVERAVTVTSETELFA